MTRKTKDFYKPLKRIITQEIITSWTVSLSALNPKQIGPNQDA